MKIRFNPESQICEVLDGETWQPLPAVDALGDYCAFEIEVPSRFFELTTEHDSGPERSFHATEQLAIDAALAYVRRELDTLVGEDDESLRVKFDRNVERDGVEDALDAALSEYGPEISYAITMVITPGATS